MRKLISIIILLCVSLSCHAKPDEEVVRAMTKLTTLTADEIRRDYNQCEGNTYQMMVCASYQWVIEDLRLNKIYSQLKTKATAQNQEKMLQDSERTWIAYRDSACRFEGELAAGGGTAEGLYILACKKRITKERADDLAELLTNE
jgi:uncharacterized protein YecT (DUF1311 family)